MKVIDSIQRALISRQYRITLRESANGILAGRAGAEIRPVELADQAEAVARELLERIAKQELE